MQDSGDSAEGKRWPPKGEQRGTPAEAPLVLAEAGASERRKARKEFSQGIRLRPWQGGSRLSDKIFICFSIVSKLLDLTEDLLENSGGSTLSES